jgi:hypothetical protein
MHGLLPAFRGSSRCANDLDNPSKYGGEGMFRAVDAIVVTGERRFIFLHLGTSY